MVICAIFVVDSDDHMQSYLRLLNQTDGKLSSEFWNEESAGPYLMAERITSLFRENARGFHPICGIVATKYSTIVVVWKKACLGLGWDRKYKLFSRGRVESLIWKAAWEVGHIF